MNTTRGMSTMGRLRTVAGGLLGAAAMTLATLSPAQAAVVITPDGTLGGPLHAEMYPSGLETAPDGTIVIADTGNNSVARYAANGTELWRVGTFGAGTNQFDNPRDIGIDADNNVYVADTRNSRVVKLSPSGAWLGSSTGPSPAYSFPLGVSVSGNKVYVGDTGRHRVVVTDLNFTVLSTVVANGVCTNINDLRDAQADSDGNIYVAGYKTNEVVKFAANGTCISKWGGTGTTPGKFRTPYGVDLAVDPVTGQELVYVADGLNNRVQVFSKTGTFVTEFGTFGEPDVPGTFTTMRRVAVAKDGSGDVWAADLWGNRMERWDRTATGFQYAQTVGVPLPEPTSTAVFHEPRGMAFTPNGHLLVADTVHHGIVDLDANGNYSATCGQRAAEGTQLGQFNWPRGIAVDPGTGNMWVADTKQHQLQVLTSDCQGIGFVKNTPAGTDTRSFNWPYDISIRTSDRFAFVVDTQNHRIKAYDVANAVFPADNKGPLPTTVFGSRGTGANNFMNPSGIAVSPNGRVFVADRGNNRVTEFTYSPAAGFARVASYTAGGTLDGPEGVAVDQDGRIIVADSNDNEVVVLTSAGVLDGTISGLNHPANVEISPSGQLYVADTYDDVIRVYDITPGAPPDTIIPSGVVTSPTPNASFPIGQVTLTGTATDNSAVGAAYVAVKRVSTNTWLKSNGTYGTFGWLPASLGTPGATSSSWSFSFTPPATGAYAMQLRVDDATGNQNLPKPFVSFSVVAGPDGATPTGTITAPAQGATVGQPVLISGTAADDVGVFDVRLGIKSTTTGLWWNGTAWQSASTKVNATLGTPGGTSTTWSYSLPAGLTPGGYGFSTDVTDTAGKLATGSGKPTWRSFTVTN